jgi:NADPH:quinone reductase-like Zn-dependent oxidoreductase
MKAVQIHEFGGADKLIYEDAKEPEIKSDDVLIKVYATSVNPIDWKMRGGGYPGSEEREFPIILGWDVSGVIEGKGDEVEGFEIGDEVYSRPDPKRNGTYAEYVAVNYKQIGLKPKSIVHAEAAAVPLAGLTAWQGLFDHGKLESGQKILIHAAAGGVGTFAVQLAKWKGAYVIGTSSDEHIDFLTMLGVDKVIDYNNEDFTERLKDIDVVFDLIGGNVQKQSLKVLKPGGILVSTVGIQDEKALEEKGIIGAAYMAQSTKENLDQLAQLIDGGKLKPIISETLPLAKAAEAHRKSERGHLLGKIVLKVVD